MAPFNPQSSKHLCECLNKTPVSPNCKTIPRRSGHRYIPPPIRAEHDMFVVCLGAIGEGRASHGQQVRVRGHQRGLWGTHQTPAGTTQAAAASQRGAHQRCRWRMTQYQDLNQHISVFHVISGHQDPMILTHLWTVEWWEACPRPGHLLLPRWGREAPRLAASPPSCGLSRGWLSGSATPNCWPQGSCKASRSAASGADAPSGKLLPLTGLSFKRKKSQVTLNFVSDLNSDF